MAKGKYEEWLTPDGLLRLEAYARDGLIDEQIAKNLGISRETLYQWKSKYADFSDALKRGKEVVDIEVENALLKRALGYTFEETTKEAVKDRETGEISLEITKVVKKEVQPDTTAQIFWLKNRKPKEWRDKQELDLGNKDGQPFQIESMTAEERRKRIEELLNK